MTAAGLAASLLCFRPMHSPEHLAGEDPTYLSAAPLTAGQLDRKGDRSPGRERNRGALYVSQNCHRSAGLDVAYFEGVLTLYCRKCRSPVAHIQVAA